MKILIVDSDTLQQHIPVNADFAMQRIAPFLFRAQREHLLPLLGRLLLNQLQLLVDDEAAYSNVIADIAAQNFLIAQHNLTHPDNLRPLVPTIPSVPQMQALLPWVQAPLAALAYELYIPWGQLNIGSTGFRIVVSASEKTAFQWQINDLETSARNIGYTALEGLLEFLEENKSSYTAWTASETYAEAAVCFVPTAKEFSRVFNIRNSRLTYLRVVGIMQRVESNQIKGALCTPLFLELKAQMLARNLSPENQKLLELIKPAVVLFSMHRALLELSVKITDNGVMLFNNNNSQTTQVEQPAELSRLEKMREEAKTEAEAYLLSLNKCLRDNLDSYPLFRDSPCYVPERTERYQNNATHKTYFAG